MGPFLEVVVFEETISILGPLIARFLQIDPRLTSPDGS